MVSSARRTLEVDQCTQQEVSDLPAVDMRVPQNISSTAVRVSRTYERGDESFRACEIDCVDRSWVDMVVFTVMMVGIIRMLTKRVV